MDYESPTKRDLVQLVQKCLNENGKGFIERQQFVSFCADLSINHDELDNVFNELDSDKDGRINLSDFASGFDQVADAVGKGQPRRPIVNGSVDKSIYECQVNPLESPMQVIAGQQYISELYYNLTNSNQPDLLDLFEKHLTSVIKDIKSLSAENQRLEEALKRATKQHARQVSNLDLEVEQQMEKLEVKVRQEEKSRSEKKLADLQWQLENKDREVLTMGKTIETLQSALNKETTKASLKEEMEMLSQENRFLKSQVTDSQTSLALLRSELAQLRSEFVEQSEQLQKEQRIASDCLHEQENLSRQLQLLHEANKKLHDINDELQGALETKTSTNSPQRQTSDVLELPNAFSEPRLDLSVNTSSPKCGRCRSATPSGSRTPLQSLDGDYCENNLNEDSLFSEIYRANTPCKSDADEEDEAYGTMPKKKKDHVEKQIQILEDTNKRLSSSNDELRVALKLLARSGSFRKPKKSSGKPRPSSFHSDYGSLSSRSSRSFSPKQNRLSNRDIGDATDESTTYDAEVEDDDNVGIVSDSTTMNSETTADLEKQFLKIKEDPDNEEQSKDIVEEEDVDDEEDDDVNSAELAELVAMASELSDVSDSDAELETAEDGVRRGSSANREEMSTMTSNSLSLSYGTPERMYKLVLAGDAAVGKSSFILRLCKNKFHSNLNATLGVDFQVKNLEVDSKTVALQLWDTAGQERFRSIAKSYFRRVDGVLLLYDVTCESSFVNIRDWMETIRDSAQKKVPIMLVGNKCDLREEYKQEGRKVISRENGQRLARMYDALFIETSAKDGKNIQDACKQLARILTSLENEEIEQSGLKLDKFDREKKKRACCSS